MTTEGRPARRRRMHAAAGGRLLVGGVSASLMLGLIGAMTRAERAATGEAPAAVETQAGARPVAPRPQAGGAPPQSAVAVPQPTAAPPEVQAPPPVRVTRTTSPPVTTSRGS